MIKASWTKHTLEFKTPGGTSRGVLTTKPSWIIKLCDSNNLHTVGYGECSQIPNLSFDYSSDFEQHLNAFVKDDLSPDILLGDELKKFPSIKFGLETAFLDLLNNGNHILFPSEFTNGADGISINGLIWMGSADEMTHQIKTKLDEGYKCLKLKIGAIDFNSELAILKLIRKQYSSHILEIRVDANGAFSAKEAPTKLNKLAPFNIHSIEQPIRQGQWPEMAKLCQTSPIPIALDEELIGISDSLMMAQLVEVINPQYLILKPGLLGGFTICNQWIELAKQNNVNWWVTSALEGNIGLNAIAQWTYTKNNPLHQGLGTGMLFTNNIPSPLIIKNSSLFYDPQMAWDFNTLSV